MLNGKIYFMCSSSKIPISISHLTQEQSYTIDVLRKENYSQTEIAKRIGKSNSVVCAELQSSSDERSGIYEEF